MLLRQQCGWCEYRNLLATLYGRERSTHRDFRLAEANVTAHYAVHRARARQVSQDSADGLCLIIRFLEWKGVGEGLVVELVEGKAQALLGFAPRVQVQQLGGDIAYLLGGALAGFRPLIRAELVQRRA